MSIQGITEQDIANYLANTPGFFERHAELLGAVQLTRRDASVAFGWSLFNWIADVFCLLFACWAIGAHPSIAGIAVPGMPMGSPGMEMGDTRDAYDVLLVLADGSSRIYQSYASKTSVKS